MRQAFVRIKGTLRLCARHHVCLFSRGVCEQSSAHHLVFTEAVKVAVDLWMMMVDTTSTMQQQESEPQGMRDLSEDEQKQETDFQAQVLVCHNLLGRTRCCEETYPPLGSGRFWVSQDGQVSLQWVNALADSKLPYDFVLNRCVYGPHIILKFMCILSTAALLVSGAKCCLCCVRSMHEVEVCLANCSICYGHMLHA